MFTLQDGREHLYQWDLNRYIIVNDPTICEVHFCNRTSDRSLVVEVKDGLAAIPNILLQDARPIRAYAYCDDQYTLTEQQFTVKSRTQPSDYVYEETDVIRWDTIAENAEKAVTEALAASESAKKTADELYDYVENNTLVIKDDGNGNVTLDGVQLEDDINFATEEYVDNAIANIPVTDLTDYATEEYVNTAIDNVEHIGAQGTVVTSEIFNVYSGWNMNKATAQYAHAEGSRTEASGQSSHAEGEGTKAQKKASHAEGYSTTASGYYSHSEGSNTMASGANSHTEGHGTTASGMASHAEGFATAAQSDYQHVSGRANESDNNNRYAVIVGNGELEITEDLTMVKSRSNAHTLDWDGNAWFAGDVKVGANREVLATVSYVDSKAGGSVDLSNYYTKAEIDTKGYQTAEQVTTAINDALGVIENGTY